MQAALVEQIAKLVDGGTLTGVSDIRDESDRDGMRVVVEVKRGKCREEARGCVRSACLHVQVPAHLDHHQSVRVCRRVGGRRAQPARQAHHRSNAVLMQHGRIGRRPATHSKPERLPDGVLDVQVRSLCCCHQASWVHRVREQHSKLILYLCVFTGSGAKWWSAAPSLT